MSLQGIYTPLPTFFSPDGLLDMETQLNHFKYIETSGVSGVLVGGSTGEAVHLSPQERYTLVQSIASKSSDSFTVMAGAVGNCVAEVVDDIKWLQKMAAKFAVVLVPGYYGKLVQQNGLVAWFKAIADQSVLPIVIYNYPGVQNGIDLTYDSYMELSKHPNIVGCKLTHYNFPLYILLAQSRELKANGFTVMAGVGQVLLPSLLVGAEGCIDGLSNIFPRAMVQIYTLFQAGEYQKCGELQRLVTEVNEMTAELNLLGLKHGLSYLGYGNGEARPPLNQSIDMRVWEKYLPAFEELLKVERSL